MSTPARPMHRPLVGALCALLVTSTAAAQPAPAVVDPARYDIYAASVAGGSQVHTTPGAYTTTNGAAAVSVRTAPFTLLTAHATTPWLYDVSIGRARMYYSFRILGEAGTRVGATFTADLFGTVVGLGRDEQTDALAQFTITASHFTDGFYDPQGNQIFRLRRTLQDGVTLPLPGGGPGYTARFHTPVGFLVDANAQYNVVLDVVAQTATPGVVTDASLDPVITIDPAQQGAYRLLLSAGVSNRAPGASVVPEPTTLALAGAGLAGLALAARRRRAA